MEKDNVPKVSIGLAVFNGEKYLKEAINSILAQTFTDFELIVSDNASTDRTENICREYAAKDSRIRYYRNSINIGGANNENLTFKLSRGQYFRWAAHDDVLAPELIARCVEMLDREPSLVLCYSMTIAIDEKSSPKNIKANKIGLADNLYQRFISLAQKEHHCEMSYGLIRADILRKTQLQKNYTDSDRTLMCELSLYGRFYEIPEALFYKRYHAKNGYPGMISLYTRIAWFNPELMGKVVFPPHWRQFFDYLSIITRTPISWHDKLRCYLFMGSWIYSNRIALTKDVLITLGLTLLTPQRREQMYKKTMNWL